MPSRFVRSGFLFAALLGGAPNTFAGGLAPAVVAAFEEWSLSPPAVTEIVFCHGFGCNFRTPVGLSNADRAQFAKLMLPGRANGAAERAAIAAAVAWFERRAGAIAGTERRTPYAAGMALNPGELDCIDTSANTTSVLVVLDLLGLLHHHRIAAPVSGAGYGAVHWAAAIEESASGNHWSIDSWQVAHGEKPRIEPVHFTEEARTSFVPSLPSRSNLPSRKRR